MFQCFPNFSLSLFLFGPVGETQFDNKFKRRSRISFSEEKLEDSLSSKIRKRLRTLGSNRARQRCSFPLRRNPRRARSRLCNVSELPFNDGSRKKKSIESEPASSPDKVGGPGVGDGARFMIPVCRSFRTSRARLPPRPRSFEAQLRDTVRNIVLADKKRKGNLSRAGHGNITGRNIKDELF